MNRTAFWRSWPAGAVLGALFLVFGPAAQADGIFQLCGIDQRQFSRFAYPAGVPYFDNQLVKWSRPPGLLVLAPDKGWEDESKRLFNHLSNDGLPVPAPVEFIQYASRSEIQDAAQQHGVSNVFIVIDPAGFSESPERDELRQAMADVLWSPKIVDRLLADALKTQRWSIQSHLNVGTGEVYVSAAVINPAIGKQAVSHAVYTLYYAALSPPATYRVQDFFDAMFLSETTSDAARLSEFAKAYYRVVLDPRVPTGARPDQFGACSG